MKWISVSDSLPPSNRKVLVLENPMGLCIATYYRKSDCGWFCQNLLGGTITASENVKYWCSIPEFPEEYKWRE